MTGYEVNGEVKRDPWIGADKLSLFGDIIWGKIIILAS
jgi:hypothetical protein